MNAVMRELSALDGDRDAIVGCAQRCEDMLRIEGACVSIGMYEDAAYWAEQAEVHSAHAFAIATW